MLTTHFYNLCKLCKKYKTNIDNKQMGWKNDENLSNNEYQFTYKIMKGISQIKGNNVLKQLNYPLTLINDASNILITFDINLNNQNKYNITNNDLLRLLSLSGIVLSLVACIWFIFLIVEP